MDKWTQIILEMEDMWHNSAEYKYMPLNIPKEDYIKQRDLYKAERIYDLYGYDYFFKFIQSCPSTHEFLDSFVPCKREPHKFQCTMFCHKYDFEKGCTLNATE